MEFGLNSFVSILETISRSFPRSFIKVMLFKLYWYVSVKFLIASSSFQFD